MREVHRFESCTAHHKFRSPELFSGVFYFCAGLKLAVIPLSSLRTRVQNDTEAVNALRGVEKTGTATRKIFSGAPRVSPQRNCTSWDSFSLCHSYPQRPSPTIPTKGGQRPREQQSGLPGKWILARLHPPIACGNNSTSYPPPVAGRSLAGRQSRLPGPRILAKLRLPGDTPISHQPLCIVHRMGVYYKQDPPLRKQGREVRAVICGVGQDDAVRYATSDTT